MATTCVQCKQQIEQWNQQCGSCGYHVVLEKDEEMKERYLRAPSLGALLFTQGWTFGSRLYVWFLLSLMPVVGLVALFACLWFGRRWSWKYGGWESWEVFEKRMRTLDLVALVWIGTLFLVYVVNRYWWQGEFSF